jgi:tetratricopeptide (TPR) repeat protein
MTETSKNKFKHLSLIYIIVNVILVPLVYTPWTLDPSLSGRFFIWSLVLLAFAIFILIKRDFLISKTSALNHLIIKLYFGYLLFSGISVLFATNLSEALVEWFKLFHVFSFIVMGLILFGRKKNFYQQITKVVIAFVSIHTLIGLIQFIVVIFEVSAYNHQVSYLINGVSAHRNLYSQLLVIGIPFCLYGFLYMKGLWKYLGLFSAIFALVLIIVLLTKTVWIAFLIGAVSTILLFINYYSHFYTTRRSLFKLLAGFMVTVVLVAATFLFYSKIDSWETLGKQSLWLRNYKFGSSLERVDLWEKSLEMYRDYIFTGVGQGNWRIVLPKYGTDGLRSEGGQIFFNRPHNDFVGVLSEIGVFGFIIYLSLFVIIFNNFFRIIKGESSHDFKIFSLFLFGSFVSFFIISVLSFPKERAEHNLLMGVIFILSILISPTNKQRIKKVSTQYQTWLLVALAAILFVNAIINLQRYRSEYYLKLAFVDRDRGNWNGVLENTAKADNFFYTLDNTSVPVSWYEASALFNNGNIEDAFFAFGKAFEYHPYNLHVLNNLATCYEIRGDHENAIKLYNATLEISSRFEDALLNLIIVYYNLQQTDVAFDVLEKVDLQSMHPKFDRTLSVLIKSRVEAIQNKIDDEDLKVTVDRISNDDKWFKMVYTHARENMVNLDEQIVWESIFVMRVMDSTINSNRADYLKEKYIDNKFW